MPDNQPAADRPATFLEVLSIPGIMLCVLILVTISTWGVGWLAYLMGGNSHRGAAIYGFASVCTFLSLWLVLGAVFAYLNVGQQTKIEIITGFYTPDTIADYFDQFWAGRDGFRALTANYRGAAGAVKTGLAADLEAKFKELFADDFGLKVFIVPVVILVAAGAIVLLLGFAGGLGYAVSLGDSAKTFPVQPFGIKFELVSIAAIFGAYTWIASDAIVRSHQWTLHPSDLAWYALRLIVAVPLGQALAAAAGGGTVAAGVTVPSGIGAFAAFVGSMFSFDSITKALGTAATRFGMPMASSPEERDDLVVKLAGVDELRAQALATEGVTTIGQLVTVDPVRISIRTGLSFEYILNLVNAALLWVFVTNTLKVLAPLGLRGASDVLALDDGWRRDDAVALAALRKADSDLVQARKESAAAPGDTAKAAAATEAEQLRTDALGAFLATLAADTTVAPDHAAMIAALTTASKDGGPGLTAVGFDTIRQRLRENSYAVFIKKLLDQ